MFFKKKEISKNTLIERAFSPKKEAFIGSNGEIDSNELFIESYILIHVLV